jgi:DNA-directed RNA polymerase subunit RPC12/RpoP
MALIQHVQSAAHLPRTLECFNCKSTFKNTSSFAHHLEAGNCLKVTRQQIYSAISKWENQQGMQNFITTRRLTYTSTSDNFTYIADEEAFNGYSFECALCHRGFSTLKGLNQHLNSPAHEAKDFRCPKCKHKFTVVSALIQHIESGSCGLATETTVRRIGEVVTGSVRRYLA